MSKTHKIKISEEDHLQRIDVTLAKIFSEFSRSYWQKRIDSGDVLLDGQKCSKHGLKLIIGNIIEVNIPDPEKWDLEAENIPLDIIFEDQYLLVINKSAGMPVHPGAGHSSRTLVNALLHHYGSNLSSINGVERPGIVHRLDKDTSGLIVIAKTDAVHRGLSKQFADKTAGRIYESINWFVPKDSKGRIETFLNRDRKDRKKFAVRQEGKHAITNYKVLRPFSFCSLTEVQLDTGRTHQIRVHMQFIGNPVFGDDIYGGGRKILNRVPVMDRKFAGHLLKSTPYLLLHAKELSFIHPESKERLTFTTRPPEYFISTIEKLETREKQLKDFKR